MQLKMMKRITLFACCFFYLSLASKGQECFNVNTSTHRMVDSFGRERFFHGMNVVVKGPPWIPQTRGSFDPRWSFNEKDMQTFESLGWNAIRLGMMWPGAEPEKDHFNETYFDVMKWIVKTAADYNISVLLDMHQDVLSAKFCGEGAPDWAIETGDAAGFPEPVAKPYAIDPKTGYPSKEDCASHSWADYYPTEATSAAFQHLYNNTDGLLDQLAEFWGKVASEFKIFSNILGYEIINEPWAGDIFHDPLLLLPEIPDRKNLQHVYDVVSVAIWKEDPCHNVFFESITWDEWTTGFERVPVNESNSYRSIVSYHIYFPPQLSPEISFFFREEDMKRLKCGGFLTEFGVGDKQSEDILQLADEHLQSWLGWDYKPYYGITGDGGSIWFDNGTINKDKAMKLSRTFATTVAGFTQSMTFDIESKNFMLEFLTTSTCKSSQTEIYLNEDLHYPNGYVVSTSSNGLTWSSPKSNHLIFNHDVNLPASTKLSISIKPK